MGMTYHLAFESLLFCGPANENALDDQLILRVPLFLTRHRPWKKKSLDTFFATTEAFARAVRTFRWFYLLMCWSYPFPQGQENENLKIELASASQAKKCTLPPPRQLWKQMGYTKTRKAGLQTLGQRDQQEPVKYCHNVHLDRDSSEPKWRQHRFFLILQLLR